MSDLQHMTENAVQTVPANSARWPCARVKAADRTRGLLPKNRIATLQWRSSHILTCLVVLCTYHTSSTSIPHTLQQDNGGVAGMRGLLILAGLLAESNGTSSHFYRPRSVKLQDFTSFSSEPQTQHFANRWHQLRTLGHIGCTKGKRSASLDFSSSPV